jgi:hypothetical protein
MKPVSTAFAAIDGDVTVWVWPPIQSLASNTVMSWRRLSR